MSPDPDSEGERRPFLLLERLHGDPLMAEIFSEGRTIDAWLDVERTLARAQGRLGIIDGDDVAAIVEAADQRRLDLDDLWEDSRNVGYPILPLVRAMARVLPDGPNGRVHYGATTQDVMDTALALQIRQALDRLRLLISAFGDVLADHVDAHCGVVQAARTHAQQAVPTTFGSKLAVFLAELDRHRSRLAQVTSRVCTVSLFGAGGTSAALGAKAGELRKLMATDLGLADATVPWHVARDGVTEFGLLCALVSATCARFAREVIDMGRTEIAEVREANGHHRGASSTMPQKENPILSEAVVGMSVTAGALASALLRSMEAGHERAAGEWQVEWQVVPQVACAASAALCLVTEIASSLRIFPAMMRRNLDADGGLIMAEAYMMALAPALGRERAHDAVTAAAQYSRDNGISLVEAIESEQYGFVRELLGDRFPISPDEYLGDTLLICTSAVATWRTPP